MIIHLNPSRGAGRAPIPQSRDVVRRYPRILSGRLPILCFVLHRMGFFVPRELLSERSALTSPFHPCLRFSQRTGGVFSVTLSVVTIFQSRRPRYFTWHAAVWCSDFPLVNPAKAGLTSDHLPSAENLAQKQ